MSKYPTKAKWEQTVFTVGFKKSVALGSRNRQHFGSKLCSN